MGNLANGLLVAKVAHARRRPKKNAFCYGAYYLSFSLRELHELWRLRLLSSHRWNLFSFRLKDYGPCDGSDPESWIRELLKQWEIPQADGRIVLVTMPRVLGYGFNPVSFWFCFDHDERLRAVLSEVRNTFGDRHCYLSFHDDRRPILQEDILRAEKIFHVSPFIEIRGYYLFRFSYQEDRIGVWIDYADEEGVMLTTSMVGKRIPLTSWNLLRCFLRYPLVTFKVITLIHYQALRLVLLGVRYLTRAAPPSHEVSR